MWQYVAEGTIFLCCLIDGQCRGPSMNGRDHVAEQQLTSLLKVFFTANKKSKNEWKISSTRAANSFMARGYWGRTHNWSKSLKSNTKFAHKKSKNV